MRGWRQTRYCARFSVGGHGRIGVRGIRMGCDPRDISQGQNGRVEYRTRNGRTSRTISVSAVAPSLRDSRTPVARQRCRPCRRPRCNIVRVEHPVTGGRRNSVTEGWATPRGAIVIAARRGRAVATRMCARGAGGAWGTGRGRCRAGLGGRCARRGRRAIRRARLFRPGPRPGTAA